MRHTERLSRALTRSASLQTYTTIGTLVDRGQASDAYRAYAYFRWVDDRVDKDLVSPGDRLDFVDRQAELINACYAAGTPSNLEPEEYILADLIRNHPREDSPLASYVRSLMSVMRFDAERRGRLISHAELNGYQRALAVAVTEAMHYFIGRDQPAPHTSERYLAVTGAHIVHMLRDTYDDVRAGYFNIPSEFLKAHGISPLDVESAAYTTWIRMRVEEARRCFTAGRRYLRQVSSLRCRLAAFAYMARFECVLDLIERDQFRLRPDYAARKTAGSALRMAGSILVSSLRMDWTALAQGTGAPERLDGGL